MVLFYKTVFENRFENTENTIFVFFENFSCYFNLMFFVFFKIKSLGTNHILFIFLILINF